MTKAQLIAAVRALNMTCTYNTDTREYRVNYVGGAEATACYDTDRDSMLATAKAMKAQRADFDKRVETFNEIRCALRHAQRVLRAESRSNGDTLGKTDADTIEALIQSLQDEFNSRANASTVPAASVAALTDKEFEVLQAIDKSEYGDHLTDEVWTFTIADNSKLSGKVISGAVSSLAKKELVRVSSMEVNKREATIQVTESGASVYRVAAAARGVKVNKG